MEWSFGIECVFLVVRLWVVGLCILFFFGGLCFDDGWLILDFGVIEVLRVGYSFFGVFCDL